MEQEIASLQAKNNPDHVYFQNKLLDPMDVNNLLLAVVAVGVAAATVAVVDEARRRHVELWITKHVKTEIWINGKEGVGESEKNSKKTKKIANINIFYQHQESW